MRRSDKHIFRLELPRIAAKTGGTCCLCGEPLVRKTRAYAGFDFSRKVVLSGECCVHRMKVILVSDLYQGGGTHAFGDSRLRK